MGALDKIAEMHRPVARAGMPGPECIECMTAWPCATRRLCDEAADETNLTEAEAQAMWEAGEPVDISVDPELRMTIIAGPELASAMASVGYPNPYALTADRDAARADAERLAAEVRQLKVMLRHWSKPMGETDEWRPLSVRESLRTATAALAAHDALTAETEGT